MTTLPTTLLFSALFNAGVSQPAPPNQPDSGASPPTSAPARSIKQGPRRQHPGPGTPQDQDQARKDRLVAQAARDYRLDELQKAAVRREIDALYSERRIAMGPEAAEYDQLREELTRLWNQESAGDARSERTRDRWRKLRSNPRFLESQRRIAEIERKYPFDWQVSVQRVEALLPPDQVEKSHDRRRKVDQMRQTSKAQSEARRKTAKSGERAATSPPAESVADPPAPNQSGDSMKVPPDSANAAAIRSTVPIHPWELYVRKFIVDHALTSVQSNAALAILKDAKNRAVQIGKSNTDRLAAANRIPDHAVRDKRLAELNRPIEQLFDELKLRLDALLTASQRARSAPPADLPP